MTQLTELDYESIENAVMETARGRWFLAEHKKRHGGTDTPAILDAIARLEKVISSMNTGMNTGEPVQATSPGEVEKPSIPPFVPAVVDIPGALEPSKSEPASLSGENLKFFSNDEDLFADDKTSFLSEPVANNETSEVAKEKLETTAEPEETSQASEPGSERFKIFKTAPESPEKKSAPEIDVSEANDVPDPTLHATAAEQDRIVVIRNTAGDDIDIPLADELLDSSDGEQTRSSTN